MGGASWCSLAVNRKCCSKGRQEVLGCAFSLSKMTELTFDLCVCCRNPVLLSAAKPSLPPQANVQLRVKTVASPADRLSQSRSMVLQDPILQIPVSTASFSVRGSATEPHFTSSLYVLLRLLAIEGTSHSMMSREQAGALRSPSHWLVTKQEQRLNTDMLLGVLLMMAR